MHRRIAIMALALTLVYSQVGSADAGKDSSQISAATFELKDTGGKVHRLNDYLSKGSVILWFTNLCSGCQSALPQLKETFAGSKVPLLMVSVLGEDRKTPAQVKEKYGLNFPILLDPDGSVVKKYSGSYIENTCPMKNFYRIEKDGRISFKNHYPGLDKIELEELIKGVIDP